MGIALEFAQRWLGYRSFEVADMVANTVGVALGLSITMIRILR
jgi:VanZ family protein